MKLSNKVTLLAVLSLVAGVVGVSARAGSVSGLSAASVSAAVISASSLSSLKSSFSSLNVKGKLSAPALTLYASCDDERAAYSSAVSSYNSCLVSTAMGPAKDAYSTVQGWISYCGNLSNTDCAAKVAADQVVYCETTYAPTAKKSAQDACVADCKSKSASSKSTKAARDAAKAAYDAAEATYQAAKLLSDACAVAQ